ncbi:hypothetical protein BJ684DRAFT_21199 [Piptocephalis cylindrospora]|uniref:Uncharacterized protein n=1 Tax=Piptocephalis cylindrospora TaxID=1907219 RepID=A0A4P9Y0G6_9FUNG|nr:hypothetical protein BJ684DRAFT_21199 [Piptocephalis cylindrospora]|eukprot:RKP12245.1 hypothetical protein BJ684DRAFT_21199 [Piptocephalis cylindrospora]
MTIPAVNIRPQTALAKGGGPFGERSSSPAPSTSSTSSSSSSTSNRRSIINFFGRNKTPLPSKEPSSPSSIASFTHRPPSPRPNRDSIDSVSSASHPANQGMLLSTPPRPSAPSSSSSPSPSAPLKDSSGQQSSKSLGRRIRRVLSASSLRESIRSSRESIVMEEEEEEEEEGKENGQYEEPLERKKTPSSHAKEARGSHPSHRPTSSISGKSYSQVASSGHHRTSSPHGKSPLPRRKGEGHHHSPGAGIPRKANGPSDSSPLKSSTKPDAHHHPSRGRDRGYTLPSNFQLAPILFPGMNHSPGPSSFSSISSRDGAMASGSGLYTSPGGYPPSPGSMALPPMIRPPNHARTSSYASVRLDVNSLVVPGSPSSIASTSSSASSAAPSPSPSPSPSYMNGRGMSGGSPRLDPHRGGSPILGPYGSSPVPDRKIRAIPSPWNTPFFLSLLLLLLPSFTHHGWRWRLSGPGPGKTTSWGQKCK